MSDGVLAAIIAAGATVFTSIVQLRTTVAKEIAARGRTISSRGKSPLPPVLLIVMLLGAVVGGFALAQWVDENERAAEQALVRDLRERVGDLTRYKSDMEQSRAELRSVVETDVLRRIGAEGVEVLAQAPPCRAAIAAGSGATIAAGSAATPTLAPIAAAAPAATQLLAASIPPHAPSPQSMAVPPRPTSQRPAPGCMESNASPIVLCATIPAAAQLGGVELYVRETNPAGRWIDTRAMPGVESANARFAAKPTELPDGPAAKQVCTGFTQWSDQPRIARMVVHYSL